MIRKGAWCFLLCQASLTHNTTFTWGNLILCLDYGKDNQESNNLGGYRELWKHYTLSWVYKPKNVFYGSSLTKLQPSWSLFNLQKVKVHVGIVMTGFAQLSAHGGLCSSPPAVSLRNAFLRQVLSASF